MYFEPIKRTYYRFPSSNTIQDLDAKYYFPEKAKVEKDTRFENYFSSSLSGQDIYHDI